jgi:hypothetical protein
MTDITPVDQDVDVVDLDEVEPEPPAMPGDRDNPLTLEAIHREAFLRRAASPFGDDPTVATPGADVEPQVSGPGDPDHVITLAKYGGGGNGLVAVDRETGDPVEGVAMLTPVDDDDDFSFDSAAYDDDDEEDDDFYDDDEDDVEPDDNDDEEPVEAEDLNALTIADLKARLDAAKVPYEANAHKADLVALVAESDA